MTTEHAKQWAIWLVLGFISTAVIACTSTRTVETTGNVPAAREACFNVSTVESFSPINSTSVYVRTGQDEHYLITLDSIYTSLPFATRIAISGSFSRVCSNTGAMLTFVESGRAVNARILTIEQVVSKEAAQKLADERAGVKPNG